MTPPQVCPPPPDCPLYAQRVDYGVDEPLRRAVFSERPHRADLAALVRAEANRPGSPKPSTPPTRPVLPPAPEPLPILDHLTRKGATL